MILSPQTNSKQFRLVFGLDEGPLLKALHQVFPPFPRMEGQPRCIGFVVLHADDPGSWAVQISKILAAEPKCLGFVAWNPQGSVSPAKNWKASLKAVFDEAVRLGSNLDQVLIGATELAAMPPRETTLTRLLDITRATLLHRSLVAFSHGGSRDITNHVLAPLRLLLSSGPLNLAEEWKRDASFQIAHFKQMVISDCNASWWLAADLTDAFQAVESTWAYSESPAIVIAQLERLMDLLTECRTLAGAGPPDGTTSPRSASPLLGGGSAFEPHRILVIDDHAASWRPVFELLQSKMLPSCPVRFDFWAGGGGQISSSQNRLLEMLPAYDAILLDIYLGWNLDGIQLLKVVRQHHVNLPIIIWTTSQAADLPAGAHLAHGFIFKKTTTLEQMEGILSNRVKEGRAKRRYALPGHFFDHSIRDETNRKCALRFTDYCSKQLDSFHALDDRFFRYFTDHGGRHLFKLLEFLGDILRPLISNTEVFSENADMREEEILSLYLAVFLHEFGMFRLRGKNEPQWGELAVSRTGRKTLEHELAMVRAFHALRGMVLIADKKRKHWPDEEGAYQCQKRLFDRPGGDYLRHAVALVTGHHSRLLPLDRDSFAKWDLPIDEQLGIKAAKAFGHPKPSSSQRDAALKLLSKRFYGPRAVHKTIRQCASKITPGRLEQLRKHCAIFRFVDAIDADYTRNPAEFLYLAKTVSASDRRETLKRQVVNRIRIEAGAVKIEVCVPPPSPKILEAVLGCKLEAREFAYPWMHSDDLDQIKLRAKWQKTLDHWLAEFWKKPTKYYAPDLLRRKRNGTITYRSKIEIASLTALSALWEILDEYEAIVKCNLQSTIKLDATLPWRTSHTPKEMKNMLTILFHKDGVDSLCGIGPR